ncbi:MAG: BON domain-containing protein [Candidatus Cyclobacteriaceae bacterium M3_2C_046]
MMINNSHIKQNIIDQLNWDDRVVASDIDVDVDQGKVKLQGVVPTFDARLAAEADATIIPGVSEVINELEVRYSSESFAPTNEEIATNIRKIYQWNSHIDVNSLSVTVEDGLVTLEGAVKSYWRKMQAEELAQSVKGVIKVLNKLTVVPNKDVVDEVVADDIVNALDRNQNVKVNDIDVKVQDGIVTLSGQVSDWPTRQNIYRTALYTRGVVDIKDHISISL